MIAIAEPAPPDPLQWQRLIHWVALKHVGRGLDIEDMVSEGQFGLLRACAKYDPDRDNQFNTYAVPWIRQAIGRAIERQGRLIRVPSNHHWRSKDGRSSGARRDAAERILAAGIVRDGDGVDGPRLADLAADRDGPTREPDVDPADVVAGLLRRLSPQQAEVLRLRYGLGGATPLSQAEIARGFGVSKQRVQVVEAQAMKRLRLAAQEKGATTR